MTWEEWEEKYQPMSNQIVSAPIDGYMFETYGDELEYVTSKCIDHAYHLWTVIDNGDKLYLSMGFHVVNRLGYILTEVPWTEEQLKEWQDILID